VQIDAQLLFWLFPPVLQVFRLREIFFSEIFRQAIKYIILSDFFAYHFLRSVNEQ